MIIIYRIAVRFFARLNFFGFLARTRAEIIFATVIGVADIRNIPT